MSAPPVVSDAALLHDQFVVNHGKTAALGVFASDTPLRLKRGERVVIQTRRGLEVGAVLCPASILQARLLGAVSAGKLIRRCTDEDDRQCCAGTALEQTLFDVGRAWCKRDELPIDILDVEVLFDGRHAIVQFVGEEAATEAFAQSLEKHFGVTIGMDNLAAPAQHEDDHAHGGCDKPDCGRSADGGGCTSCDSGGCSSCGSGGVDLRDYFAHLRTKMDTNQRIPLA